MGKLKEEGKRIVHQHAEEEEYKRRRELVADGAETPFWKEVTAMLEELKEDAAEALKTADPGNVSRIAQLQQMYKIPDMIISIVDSFAQEQKAIDDKKKQRIKEVLGEPAR